MRGHRRSINAKEALFVSDSSFSNSTTFYDHFFIFKLFLFYHSFIFFSFFDFLSRILLSLLLLVSVSSRRRSTHFEDDRPRPRPNRPSTPNSAPFNEKRNSIYHPQRNSETKSLNHSSITRQPTRPPVLKKICNEHSRKETHSDYER